MKNLKGAAHIFTAKMSYTLSLEVNTLEKFSKLMQFCSENNIAIPSAASNPFKPVELNREKRTPSQAYVNFCGAENLNKKGEVSEQDIYDTIVRYTSIFNLVMSDGSIKLDEALQAALGTDKSRMYEHELLSVIPKVLKH